jgi:DNA-binding protein H-NS
LSYVYAIEWPALAFFGLWGWWMLIHTEKPTEEQIAERAELERVARAEARAHAEALVGEVDEEMAAYNEQLRQLNEQRRSSWKH